MDVESTTDTPVSDSDTVNTTDFQWFPEGRPKIPDRFDATIYLLTVGCLGVLDNGFVIVVVVFYTSMTKRLTGRLILNQSCVDLVASLMVVVRQSNSLVHGYKMIFDGVLGELYCRLWLSGSLQWVFILASAVNLVAITIERYVSIVFPIYHKQNCSKTIAIPLIVCVWLFGVVYEVSWCASTFKVVGDWCMFWRNYTTIYGVSSVVIYFFIPISSMFFCYSHMAYTLRRKAAVVVPAVSSGAASNTSPLSSAQRNLFKTLFMVSACFVTCWTWYEIVWLCISADIESRRMVTMLDQAHLIAVLNLVINPFIYIFHYTEFRKGLKSMWRSRFMGQPPLESTTASARI